MPLFDPIFSTKNAAQQSALAILVIQLYGINFAHIGLEQFNVTLLYHLDKPPLPMPPSGIAGILMLPYNPPMAIPNIAC